MAIIEGFRVRNYRALKDVTMGRSWYGEGASLTPLTAVIGKNGVGKSSLFDAFGFLSDCLKQGVEEACHANGRGGYRRIHSQGVEGPIQFEIYYKESGNSRPITYELSIALDGTGRPYVQSERLRQRRKGQPYGKPFSFLILEEGRGLVWSGEQDGHVESDDGKGVDDLMNSLDLAAGTEESSDRERIELTDRTQLGIATLGSLKQHPRISQFRSFIESWYLSYFTPDAARSLPLAGPQKHLNKHGDNLGNVVQYMQRSHPRRFDDVMRTIAGKIPGIDRIDTEETNDGRLLLRFNDNGFEDPFYSQQMSDGTLKLFAYLLLLEDPTPPPFLCIEEPENGLYHKLLESLVAEFREHATGLKDGSQVFVTTHQPYFVDALAPNEVWVLEKQADGFSRVRRASDNPIVSGLAQEGLPLGGLWYSDYFDAR